MNVKVEMWMRQRKSDILKYLRHWHKYHTLLEYRYKCEFLMISIKFRAETNKKWNFMLKIIFHRGWLMPFTVAIKVKWTKKNYWKNSKLINIEKMISQTTSHSCCFWIREKSFHTHTWRTKTTTSEWTAY